MLSPSDSCSLSLVPVTWPSLEVLDLSHNKLNDFDEVRDLLSGMCLKRGVIKIVAVKGN